MRCLEQHMHKKCAASYNEPCLAVDTFNGRRLQDCYISLLFTCSGMLLIGASQEEADCVVAQQTLHRFHIHFHVVNQFLLQGHMLTRAHAHTHTHTHACTHTRTTHTHTASHVNSCTRLKRACTRLHAHPERAGAPPAPQACFR